MHDLRIWIPFVLAIIISLLLEKILDNGEKKDSGFVFCFWKLSDRRKFIRTLWLPPLMILVIILLHITSKSYFLTGIITVTCSILWLIQTVYYYKKWKQ